MLTNKERVEKLKLELTTATKSKAEIIKMQIKILQMKPREYKKEETPAKIAEEVFS